MEHPVQGLHHHGSSSEIFVQFDVPLASACRHRFIGGNAGSQDAIMDDAPRAPRFTRYVLGGFVVVARHPTVPFWAWIPPCAFGAVRRQAGLVNLQAVHASDGGGGGAHDAHVGLAETVDGLLHVADHAHRRVPQALWATWLIFRSMTRPPQSSQQAQVCRVGVLKLIDDEGPEFTAQPLETMPPALDLFDQRRVFTGQNDGPFNVCVAPRPLLPVRRNDGWMVEGAHHVFGPHAAIGLRAAGQEKVGRHALDVFEIDEPSLGLDDVEGPSVGFVHHEHVLHQPSCKGCSRAQAAFRRRDRERMVEGRGPKVGI